MANLFVKKNNRVTLIILDSTKEVFYPLDQAVNVIHQPLSFGISAEGNIVSRKIKLLSDVLKLRKILKEQKPDHIIATEYPFTVAAVLSGAVKTAKIYSWEHHHFGAMAKNSFWSFLSTRSFARIEAVICLNEDEKNYYTSLNKNTVVIPNFIDPQQKPIISYEQSKKNDILTVTRFNHIKGIDLFMSVAKIVLLANPGLTWKLIGYGPQEEEVKQFIINEDLGQQLLFQPAAAIDITKEYQEASLLVMTSRNECFPLVLLEAMSNGLPCIAFDCDTGPRHIIRHNKTGLLINKENIAEMATAISAIIKDPAKRKQMSDDALLAVEQFYPEKVYEKWETLFKLKDKQ